MKGRRLGKRIVAYLLALVMVISMVGFQAGTVKADGSESAGTEGTAYEGTGTEGTGSEGTGTEGTGSEGTGTEGTGSEGTGTEGTGSEGTGSEGTGTEGTGTEGTGSEGTGTEGTGSEGTGTEGTGTEGTGTEGTGTEGTGTEGTETEGTETWTYRYNQYEVYQLTQSQLDAALADAPEGYKWVYTCIVEEGEGHYDLDTVVCKTEAHAHNGECYTAEVTCGNTEHTHTENCYGRKPTCGLGEHVHDESCYGLVKTCTKHDHEEAGETYKECTLEGHTHTDKCYKKTLLGKKLICEKEEHHHVEGVCYGYVVGQKLNCKHPVLHLFQNLFDWEHPAECYDDVFCTEENHTHTDECFETKLTCTLHVHDDVDCYDDHALLCGNEEHTHTADCYTDKLTCEKEEHQHSVEEECYAWVNGPEAIYNCMLVTEEDDGMAELGQGNEAFSYTLTVTCKDGDPAANSKVTVTLKDFNPFAKHPTISRDLYTGIDGKIQLNYSGTYDRIISVTVDNKEILTGEIKVGYLQNRYYEDDYQLEEHEYVEVEGTAVAPTIYEEGKTADQKCKHCGAEIKGEVIEKLTSYKVSYYMLKPGIALPDGTISSPTKNWINMNKSILVENDPEGSTTSKDVIEKVLGSSEEILKPYEQTFEYNGTVYTYAKAEVFRIMKESDYDKVGYHADCRMIRGYSEDETVPYAENDIFVLYVDEDGTFIDKGYIYAQDGKITVDKSLDETYNKVHDNGKNYIFSNWIDEDGKAVEVNGTVSVGDKKVIVLTANYVEKPLARFFLLRKGEKVPSENVDDSSAKYVGIDVTGALKRGVVTYEKDGKLLVEDGEFKSIEDYIAKGLDDDAINRLLQKADYSLDDIERYGLTIDWFRTMSYDNEEFYHVDGRVIFSPVENVKVSVYKKDTAGTEEFVGSFWVSKNSTISSGAITGRYSELQPTEGYTLSWEKADGSEYIFGTPLEGDTVVYAVYTVKENENGGENEDGTSGNGGGGNTSDDGNGGGTGGNGGNGGGSTGGSTGGNNGGNNGGNTGDGGLVEIPEEDTPLAPEPGDDNNDDIDTPSDNNGGDSDQDEEITDIVDEDVPLDDGSDISGNDKNGNKADATTIEDEETPLSDNPLTGDNASVAWAALGVLAAFGLTAVFVTGKRKKED